MKEIKYKLNHLSSESSKSEIEERIRDIKGVNKAHLSFIDKELTVMVLKHEDKALLLKQITNMVKSVEKDVLVSEMSTALVYKMDGLDCANCAAKIEDKLNRTENVMSAHLDFISKKLTINIKDPLLENQIEHKAKQIIDRIEPGVTLSKMANKLDTDDSMDGMMKTEIIYFVIGLIVFVNAFLMDKGSLLYYLLLALSYVIIGGKVVWKAIKNLLHGKVFDENFLMTIATLGAFAVNEHPEAVAVMIFYQIGEFFQKVAVNRSRKSIKKLMSIRPDVATLKVGNDYQVVSVERINVGDIIVIKPGERIPLDGMIIEGSSSVDNKVLTGESLPQTVNPHDLVLSGCSNLSGVLTVKVSKPFGESTASVILEMVQNATSKKAQTEHFITKFARIYTPIVTIFALLLAVIPPLIIQDASFEDWLYRALIFLVISCPCALVVSIPLGFFGGIGAASKHGILVKGGNYLEALNQVEIAVFDKTGTLTAGSFEVTEVWPCGEMTKDELLRITAHVESFSNHPIAQSILKTYPNQVDSSLVTQVEELPGFGLKATYLSDSILIGNEKLMMKETITFKPSSALGTVLYVAKNHRHIGEIILSDVLKQDSKETIKRLKALGVKKTVMLTGDKKAISDDIGNRLEMDVIHSELLPGEKLRMVEELLKQTSKKGKLFFVGDGINDTPVLARSDIGIAMGGLGADAAIDIADIVIMNDEPLSIVTAIMIAKKTRRIVWQNILFALGIKLLFLSLGAIGMATMWEAVIADVGVSLLAVLNAMRVLKTKI
ncbi:MAG: heavy metal translocating P-type ATPase [Acholeplasma sp.]|nr:heavy metal translocating P-type ATPase [Acholeplasma sp.]